MRSNYNVYKIAFLYSNIVAEKQSLNTNFFTLSISREAIVDVLASVKSNYTFIRLLILYTKILGEKQSLNNKFFTVIISREAIADALVNFIYTVRFEERSNHIYSYIDLEFYWISNR